MYPLELLDVPITSNENNFIYLPKAIKPSLKGFFLVKIHSNAYLHLLLGSITLHNKYIFFQCSLRGGEIYIACRANHQLQRTSKPGE